MQSVILRINSSTIECKTNSSKTIIQLSMATDVIRNRLEFCVFENFSNAIEENLDGFLLFSK